MRVIFMGTPDFAVGTLEEIIKAGHEVVLKKQGIKVHTGEGMCGCTWD